MAITRTRGMEIPSLARAAAVNAIVEENRIPILVNFGPALRQMPNGGFLKLNDRFMSIAPDRMMKVALEPSSLESDDPFKNGMTLVYKVLTNLIMWNEDGFFNFTVLFLPNKITVLAAAGGHNEKLPKLDTSLFSGATVSYIKPKPGAVLCLVCHEFHGYNPCPVGYCLFCGGQDHRTRMCPLLNKRARDIHLDIDTINFDDLKKLLIATPIYKELYKPSIDLDKGSWHVGRWFSFPEDEQGPQPEQMPESLAGREQAAETTDSSRASICFTFGSSAHASQEEEIVEVKVEENDDNDNSSGDLDQVS